MIETFITENYLFENFSIEMMHNIASLKEEKILNKNNDKKITIKNQLRKKKIKLK